MSQAVGRLLQKARAKHKTAGPSDVVFILCNQADDVAQRVEVLIRAGNLTDADRPRCVFCDGDTFVAMTHDERVFVWDVNETDEDRRRIVAASAARARAALAEIVDGSADAKSETDGSL